MSFLGIAEAWVARGNGRPSLNILKAHGLNLICEISDLGDIEVSNTLSLGCDLETENIDVMNTLALSCDHTDIGDIQLANSFSISIIIVVT